MSIDEKVEVDKRSMVLRNICVQVCVNELEEKVQEGVEILFGKVLLGVIL
jgi:hypothetical protein